MKGFLGLALPLLASASPVLLTQVDSDAAPLRSASNAKEIADNYIVIFKEHVTESHAADHHAWVQDAHTKTESAKTELRKRSQTPIVDEIFGGLKHTYNIAGNLLGYAGHFDEGVLEQIRRHPDVSSLLFKRFQSSSTPPLSCSQLAVLSVCGRACVFLVNVVDLPAFW